MSSDSVQPRSFGHRYMTGAEVRRAFVTFFERYAHREVASSSLVPHNDPTVLLTTAGMQQMTPYFLGIEKPPAPRLCSVQKCFRTVDIDEVGDESHCTFFFMLGNFSVGDYFKKDSLTWSWEFLTEVMGLPAERLYPTVHPTDTDAYTIWREQIGVPAERIGKLSDNWWGPVGNSGPNGPDSEIYFDLGEEYGDTGNGPGDGSRYLEVWNNVFMEFFQSPDGQRVPLPRQNVDTGMGLERLTMLMQGASSIYDTDLYQTIIQRAATLAKVTYGVDREKSAALRVIADHSRGATFLISDGVLPGNEGRAYVLRRILRRAIRHGRQLGLDRPFMAEMVDVVIEQFAGDYPELHQRRGQIERVVTHEEETFGRTLRQGEARFMEIVAGAAVNQGVAADRLSDAANAIAEGRPAGIISGEEAFRLYDTYGFPIDLTIEMARERGFAVDQTGFDRAMATQREISRGGGVFKDQARSRAEFYVSLGTGKTEFLGYDQHEASATVLALVGPDGVLEVAEAGQPIEVILDHTPFYAESGGQIGDAGTIRTETGLLNIDDTVKPAPNIFIHRGTVAEGFVKVGEPVHAKIDNHRRRAIRRNHTATHLLHRALRIVLGEETHQAGSLVAPDRLRFDFTSLDPVSPAQVARVAEIVNREILEDLTVTANEMPYKEAVAQGAMALFGEKYGDIVRMVVIDNFSKELCGGTHVASTGQIGPFQIVSEGSVAAGIRRIEALTGEAAVERMLTQQRLLDDLGRDLRAPWHEVPVQVAAAQERVRAADREIQRLRGQVAGAKAGNLLELAVVIGDVKVLATNVDVASREGLRQLSDRLRDQLGSGVIALGTIVNGDPALIVAVTPDIVARGVKAGDVVRQAAAIVGGRGGGRAELAEAGGKEAAKLDAAIAAVPGLVQTALDA